MRKKVFFKLILCIFFIVIVLNFLCLSESYASFGDSFSIGKNFLEAGVGRGNTINEAELEKTSDGIYNILLAAAVMVAIIVGMILGIQFMVASADEKAKVKEALVPYIIGCIVVFGSFTIWKIFVKIGNNAESSIATTYNNVIYIANVEQRPEDLKKL